MIYGLLFPGGHVLFLVGIWESYRFFWSAVISAVVASAVTYYQLVKDTGCPNCQYFIPFHRIEISREALKQFAKQSVSHKHQPIYDDKNRSTL